MSVTRLHLIFDADDTLWENNVWFERVIEDFTAWIAHPTLDAGTIRATLNDIERANAAAHGYGTRVFLRSLHDCFEHLLEQPPTAEDRARIDALAAPLLHHAVEPMPGVLETLDVLRRHHDLLLLTKGDEEEQSRKIEASGLAGHFRRVVIVPEKTAAVYAELITRERLDATRAWMIGNSPKSDVLPALEAGMGAVFVPNANTWALEHATLDEGAERLIRVERLADLLAYF
jgi:putative hydrolase of the HAD superfamily